MSIERQASKPHVRLPQEGDDLFVARRMRRLDVEEIRAASGLTPLAALQQSIALSEIVRVGTADKPFCIFGVAPSPEPSAGILWLLGTEEIVRYRKTFHREAREWIDRFHFTYPVLFNFVDERNTVHIAWLKRLGAKFINRHPQYGQEGRPFLEFIHV